MEILSIGSDAKTVKGEKFGVFTGICYLAPADESGYNVCPNSSAGCRAACLFTAGRGACTNVKTWRINKTLSFFKNRSAWMTQLQEEIEALVRKGIKLGKKIAIRLNGTSDLPWERIKCKNGLSLIENHPSVQFYDYTKSPERMIAYIKGQMPKNYHLTFSKSEENQADVELIAKMGGNIAVVFRNDLPKKYLGKKVVDGDLSDLRFMDPKGVVVGLSEKGRAKKDTSGFVVDI